MKKTPFLSYKILVILFILSNIFGFINLYSRPSDFLVQYPNLNQTLLTILTILPIVNLIGLIGLWFFKKWAIVFTIASYCIIATIDLMVPIIYHFIVATIGTGLLFFLIYKNFDRFRAR